MVTDRLLAVPPLGIVRVSIHAQERMRQRQVDVDELCTALKLDTRKTHAALLVAPRWPHNARMTCSGITIVFSRVSDGIRVVTVFRKGEA